MIHALCLLIGTSLAATEADYEVGAGDTLEVTVYGVPDLSGPFEIDDGGSVAFPLLGPIDVAGLTTPAIAEDLTTRLSPDYLVNPRITVSVSEFGSQPVQVLGSVAKPGVYYLRGDTTLLELLSEAGGVSRGGVDEIRVAHSGDEDSVSTIAYQTLLAGSEADFALQAGDIVFVPDSLVAVMGEVGKPSEIAFREGMTVSQRIAAAGGLLVTGSKRRVLILRGEDQIRVNLATILTGESSDIVLEPGDRVFVKRAIF
ncbi:MAG: hypothetical protein GY913_29700 [Proteobacteria bacterium]|nr:hypothetical protein [Pseudomonadota bacterium]MCP4921090.1 hypothetical protein [Pseudomonadota bacterium]